jgi:hypothetical protein
MGMDINARFACMVGVGGRMHFGQGALVLAVAIALGYNIIFQENLID